MDIMGPRDTDSRQCFILADATKAHDNLESRVRRPARNPSPNHERRMNVTKQRPRPKAEVVITNFIPKVLNITTYSKDAQEWVEAEAPLFGKFLRAEGEIVLIVGKGYVDAEVKEWLGQESSL